MHPAADAGFPMGGAGGGLPIYDFAKFSRKLHENERIWAPDGGGGRPPTSATGIRACCQYVTSSALWITDVLIG